MPLHFQNKTDNNSPGAALPASRPPLEPSVIRSVWERTTRQPGFETFSVDAKGTMINLFDYGRRSEYGWEIEPVVPLDRGGTLDPSNLHAVHWRNAQPTNPDGR